MATESPIESRMIELTANPQNADKIAVFSRAGALLGLADSIADMTTRFASPVEYRHIRPQSNLKPKLDSVYTSTDRATK